MGVIVVTSDKGQPELRAVRRAHPSPSRTAASVACLLWRDELLALLAARRPSPGLEVLRRRELLDLAATLPLAAVRAAARAGLKERPGWRAG